MSTTAQQQFQKGTADPGPAPVGFVTIYPRNVDGQMESQDENGIKSLLGSAPMVGDSGAGGVSGTVPAPAAGDAAAGRFLKASGLWEAPSLGGPAGGDLTGTYPNPTIAALAVNDAKISDVDFNKVTNAPTSYPPSGAAGGDLTGTYPTPQIADGAVSTAKIHDGAIIASKFATGAVTSTAIATSAVIESKIAADAVTTAKILDANVTEAKLATDSVSENKILDGAVSLGKLAAGSVDNSKVVANAGIVYSKLAHLTANRVLASSGAGHVSVSTITDTELSSLNGISSNIQTQLNGKFDDPIGTTADYLRGDGSVYPFATSFAAGINAFEIGTLVEQYAPLLATDSLMVALMKLAYSSAMVTHNISANVTVPSGTDFIRGKTRLNASMRIENGGKLRLI